MARMLARLGTPLGDMVAVADHALRLLEFHDRPELPAELARLGQLAPGRNAVIDRLEAQLAQYFAGERADFDLPLAPEGTAFQESLWAALREIPPGQTRSYAAMAVLLGRPKAVRAVGRANGANRIAVVIPCHRLVGSDGSLTGYAGGIPRKQALLRHETDRFPRQTARNGAVLA
ncbi:methylated-DNA--[protein]-cysteine S-methyltransferase [Paracoccus laeviglucosivorans]|uniref:methylated-DNA--[protein]-cysteine S-methyltransferase n=1 Tax=Paracoccus laeviglucosivorans TaxID=1197861 RepID=A0A521ASW6_9RHOB|nr:methylated-DNA--[protein]-cysteine S-methyltransferase [Paracoccus laeviglucosivorans]SMO37932.1 methylated-DNA-[protein]-cysteine S-methyltransferase [Paracoccus laeviglucosivorans]